MLSSLKIKNLALVEDVTWELSRGLVGVTGETGAGKSIIVGALKLILGERADRSLIRTGQEQCSVEASFEIADTGAIDHILDEAGVDPCEEGLLVVKRVVSSNGTNKQFINGSATTTQVLKAAGEYLVDLHGPHDHQSLRSQERQLDMLDKYAACESALAAYQSAWKAWKSTANELDELVKSERASQQQIDMLKHQITEISGAKLKPGEDEQIESRHRLVANSARLSELCGEIIERLGEGKDSLLHHLREVARMSHELERIDPASAKFFEELEPATIILRELENNLRDYASDLELDPKEFAALEERMAAIQRLRRKYAPTVDGILAHLAECERQLARMEGRTDEIARLETLLQAQRAEVEKAAKALTKKRTEAAPKLSKEISKHLADLGFKQSLFEVQFTPLTEPQRHGLEDVDYLFSPNPGEPLKPLRMTASSGEMSRVLLAVKSALAKQDSVELLVFDEIDANVGGNIAEAVGKKMAAIGNARQVIAITHFPQVASLAGSHFVVTKEVQDNRTKSTIREIRDNVRVDELARMLGGKIDSAREHARSLLAGSH
ncbi:MAG: DNA repair protein RecN [Verrucomicrobiaceae bacterium]|nr:DNA repair protein RecN [Verrucomicrobiaceae bacterium]